MSSTLQFFTAADVAKHNTDSDFWVIYHKEVYAFPSNFVSEAHPGGPHIVEVAGKDATKLFESGPHGDHAKSMLAKFKVGVLSEASA